jgi:hypothetical protein
LSARVACKAAGCTRTILAATAARTGGFCMPCLQEQARQKHEAYVRANRRDVDPYAGIHDPLEILKIVHQALKPDRLVRYAKPPRPTDVLYGELGSSQISALLRHASTLLKKGDTHAAQDIAACLVAFVSADISSLQQELIRLGALRPEFVFHRAAPKIRDLLTQHLARVAGHDVLLTDKLLGALAWVGDQRVVELFAGWRAKPPQWAADLHIPPYRYSQQAGWELSPDSLRRNLYHEVCYPLIRSDEPVTSSAVAVLTETNLLELDGTSPALAFLGCPRRIVVPICDQDLVDERMPRRTLVPAAAPRSPWHAAIDTLPTHYSQIGGHPAWIQDAEYPTCGECQRTMRCIGQVACEDVDPGREGIFYAFACADCATTASAYQQT